MEGRGFAGGSAEDLLMQFLLRAACSKEVADTRLTYKL